MRDEVSSHERATERARGDTTVQRCSTMCSTTCSAVRITPSPALYLLRRGCYAPRLLAARCSRALVARRVAICHIPALLRLHTAGCLSCERAVPSGTGLRRALRRCLWTRSPRTRSGRGRWCVPRASSLPLLAEELGQERSGDVASSSVRAARTVAARGLRLGKEFADLWVDSLLVLLPASVPPETVTQLVYVAVAVLALWVFKSLLSVRAQPLLAITGR